MLFTGSYIISAIFCFLIGLVQIIRWHSFKNYLAFLFTTIVAYQYFIYGFYISGKILNHPWLIHTQLPIIYFATVLGFFFYRMVFDARYKLSWKATLHFIFPVLYTIYLLPEIFMASEEKLSLLQGAIAAHKMPYELVAGNVYVIALFIAVYNFYSAGIFLNIARKRKTLTLKSINFKDPIIILLGWMVFHNLLLLSILFFYFLGILNLIHILLIVHLTDILILYVYAVFFPYFVQLKILLPNDKSITFRSLKISKMNHINLLDLENKLKQTMEVEKIFCEAEIKVSDLAKKIEVKAQHLSMYLNQVKKTNFTTYINGYRLREAKKILIDTPDFPVNRISYKVGFSSPSNFFAIFKKREGLTPNEYRTKHIS